MASEDGPFGSNSVLVVDLKAAAGASQFNVGAALWQPRKHHLSEDERPLSEKRSAPTYTITCFEFVDGDGFVNLDSLVVREKPAFCFLNPKLGDAERHKVEELLERSGALPAHPTRPEASSFTWPRSDASKRSELESELCTLLAAPNLHGVSEVMALSIALNSLACLMAEMRANGLCAAPSVHSGLNVDAGDAEVDSPLSVCELRLGRLESCMRLDSAAVDAIMLLPDKKAPVQAFGSLFGVLNHCKTAMGTRLLESWLRQPLVDRTALSARHDLVGCLKDGAVLRGALTEAMKQTPDLEAAVTKMRRTDKAGRHAATLADVYRLYNFSIRNLPSIKAALTSAGEEDPAVAALLERFLTALSQCDSDLAPFKALVEHVLDFSELPELRIKPEHSPALVELAEEREAAESTVREVHGATQEEWARVCSKGQIRLEAHKEEGWIMRLPSASDEQRLRKEIPQIKILGILKSGVVFTTDELRAAAAESSAVNQQYAEEQRIVADKVVATAATFVPVVEAAARLVAELDVLASFAHVAAHAPGGDYVRPSFCDDDASQEAIKLVGARHPCVELQDGVAFIANDYTFDRQGAQFQIVTGPNMGGKSTYIRGLGSIVAMAQAGSFVPCTEATLPLVDTILARVGAGDSQARGLSTFMAEMLEASTIVRTATARSLVIVDELGRGTSTFDGFGLAWAISQYLVSSVGCWTIFATHFHELTLLADEEPLVVNRHVSAHIEGSNEVTFLYEVKDGPCLSSYGVHVAAMAHFPKSVIACATRKAAELEGFDPSSALAAAAAASTSNNGTPATKKQRVEKGGSSGATAEHNRKLVALASSVKDIKALDKLDATQRLEAVRALAAETNLV